MSSTQSSTWRFVDTLLSIILLSMLVVTTFAPSAYALETAKCTARPNTDTGSTILGGTETRITWEAEAAGDESLTQITLTLPAGTDYTLDDARLTVLSGDDRMTRENPEVKFTSEGQTVVVDFKEATKPGLYYRIEVYGVKFPIAGGEMQITGTYTLDNGTTYDIPNIPSIDVQVTSPTQQLATYLEQQDWVKAWNSNKFLRLFFNPPILVSSFPIVLKGFLMALAIVFVAFPLAIPVGLAFSFMRMSKIGILRAIGALYVNVVRGTPVFLQIYIAFFGLPLAGIQIPPFILGVIVLALNSAAYQCEIFRAGIQSISKGQFEAARSLGMNGGQTMAFVIIPQTIRRVLPTMTSEFILLYKDTSLLAAVGVMEIVMYAKTIVASTGSITPYIVAAIFYLVLTIPLANLVGRLEERLSSADGGMSKKAKKHEAREARKAAREAKKAVNPGVVAEKLEEAPAHVGSGAEGAEQVAVSPERFSSM